MREGEMFDFRLFTERTVRVRLKDGSHYLGRYRTILGEWVGPKPTLWVTDWSLDHLDALDQVDEVEAA